jgi:hypothetical protein
VGRRGPLDRRQGVQGLEVLLVDLLLVVAHVADARHGEGVGAEDDDGEQSDDRSDLHTDRSVGEPSTRSPGSSGAG